jgi:hypothetical protein
MGKALGRKRKSTVACHVRFLLLALGVIGCGQWGCGNAPEEPAGGPAPSAGESAPSVSESAPAVTDPTPMPAESAKSGPDSTAADPIPGVPQIEKVTLVSEKDGNYQLKIVLDRPLPEQETNLTIRLLFLRSSAASEYADAADVEFTGGFIGTGSISTGGNSGFPYSWMQSSIVSGGQRPGYVVDITSDLSKWPKSPAKTIQLRANGEEWASGITEWISQEKKGAFHIAFMQWADDLTTRILASNNYKGTFDFTAE